ncbi:MAG: diguanylate cyclase [Candidatus Aminicenantes bacterium]|nr:diguanylate cyclase [Candidatus Aminicenantes bacterium]
MNLSRNGKIPSMEGQIVLVLSPSPAAAILLTKICDDIATVYTATRLENAFEFMTTRSIHTLIIDESFADYNIIHSALSPITSILITGENRTVVEERAKEWPLELYVDFLPVPRNSLDASGFRRAAHTALEHAFMKIELNRQRSALPKNENELSSAYSEIRDIKHVIQTTVVQELEKRIALQSKYNQFKEEKQKIEGIIKKLHTASDVTSLLDIIQDAGDIIKAVGISMYLLESSENQEDYLKPLVWNDAVLAHPEYSKHLVPIKAGDLTAIVARNGREVNSSRIALEPPLVQRFVDRLPFQMNHILCLPLKSDVRVIGVIEAYNKRTGTKEQEKGFTREDQNLLKLLSEHIAIAITNLNLIQYDALTGLLRPDPFFEKIIHKLQQEKKRRQEDSYYALVMGDVDWFKIYNDNNGHEAGNRLLRELSNILKASIREDDLICRYGGEEFLFFLSKIDDLDEACRLTERIRKSIEEHYFLQQENQPNKNLTMSFGVTAFTRDRFPSVESVNITELKRIVIEADMALSEAKSINRDDGDSRLTPAGPEDKNRVSAFFTKSSTQQGSIAPYEAKIPFEQRRHRRHSTSTLLIYKNGSVPNLTRTINLSMGGAKIPADEPFKLYQTVDIILILGEEICQMKGEVVYSARVNGHKPPYHAGLRFQEMTAEGLKKVESFLESLLSSSPTLR